MKITENAIARFEAKVVPVPWSGCHLWLGALNDSGYGIFSLKAGLLVRAHHFSFELHRRRVPRGKILRHQCDVRCCVNPWHLEPGTASQNMKEMIARGRGRHQFGSLDRLVCE